MITGATVLGVVFHGLTPLLFGHHVSTCASAASVSGSQNVMPIDWYISRLLLDSRVVIGQFLRNSLFLQAFHESRDRCGIFGKSLLISSTCMLSILCKTPEANKSPTLNCVTKEVVEAARECLIISTT